MLEFGRRFSQRAWSGIVLSRYKTPHLTRAKNFLSGVAKARLAPPCPQPRIHLFHHPIVWHEFNTKPKCSKMESCSLRQENLIQKVLPPAEPGCAQRNCAGGAAARLRELGHVDGLAKNSCGSLQWISSKICLHQLARSERAPPSVGGWAGARGNNPARPLLGLS